MQFNPDFQFDDGVRQSSHPWTFAGALTKANAEDPHLTTLDEKIQRKLAKRTVLPSRPKEDEESEESDDDLPGEVDDGDDEIEASEDEDESDDSITGEDVHAEREDNEEAAQLTELLHDLRSQRQQSEPASKKGVVSTRQCAMPASQHLGDGDREDNSATSASDDGGEGSSDENVDADIDSGSDDQDSDEEVHHSRQGAKGSGKQRARAGEGDGAAGGEGAKEFFSSTPNSTKFSAHTFASLGLSRPLLKAVSGLGYTVPTPIQAAVVPLALSGRDIVASAITGSGKTAAFALPLLERLLFRSRTVAATHVLVLCPTRELAAQVHSMIGQLAEHTDIRAALVMGGLSLSQQAAELRQAPEIVVATPGRIIDHVMNTMAFELDTLSALVLDEADRLLEMGFQDELQQILKLTPNKRQTLLFSATMSAGVKQLIQLSLSRPVRLAADVTAATPATLRQEVVRLKGGAASADKASVLCALCARTLKGLRTIIFCREKRHAHRLKILLGLADIAPASELHGDMTQTARLQALEAFRTGDSLLLLATDVAARGLDILGVQAVVNYDCPRTLDTYLHRVGRTARAGAQGLAISLVEDMDRLLVKAVMKHACKKLDKRELPKGIIETWRAKVEGLAGSVEDVLMEEKQEKAFRLAEMEATKASNIIECEAEIYSRPKREWFLTYTQKRASAQAAAQHEQSGGTRAQGSKKPKEAQEESRKGPKADRNGEVQGKQHRQHAHVSETREVMGSVKAAKAAARGFRESGAKPKEAAKAALTATGALKNEKKKPKRKQPDSHTADSHVSQAPRNSHVYAGVVPHTLKGGGKSGSVKASKTGPSKSDRARIQRGGKGKGQFKGKARYKRK